MPGSLTSTPTLEVVTCAVCSNQAEQYTSAENEPQGPPDFDTRPAEPERSFLRAQVSCCPTCGYCADDLSKSHDGVPELVAEDRYQAVLRTETYPPEARAFLCFALILERLHQWADAGWSSLHAAWICDDEGAEEAARLCRTAALQRWKRAKELGSSFADDLGSEFALAADLYRRSGDFTDALVTCAEGLDVEDLSELLERLLRRQYVLIQQHDTEPHSMSELLTK